MKYLLLFSVFITMVSWARKDMDFNQAINEDLQSEIAKDDFKYKKNLLRKPASVESDSVRPKPVQAPVNKIDKNVRQIGPQNW